MSSYQADLEDNHQFGETSQADYKNIALFTHNCSIFLGLIKGCLCRRTCFSSQASDLNLSKSETVWTRECTILSVSFQIRKAHYARVPKL